MEVVIVILIITFVLVRFWFLNNYFSKKKIIIYPTSTLPTVIATINGYFPLSLTTISWVDAKTACGSYVYLDLEVYSPDSVINQGTTVLYTDIGLTNIYDGNGLFHITSYGGGIHYILIESTGLVNEYGTC